MASSRPEQTAATSRPPKGDRAAYLVLGMHRSGTSAATQLLALSGAELPENVMPGDEHNAKGYFEPWKIALLNNERLNAGGGAWDDPFAFPYAALEPEAEAAWLDRAAELYREEFGQARYPLLKDPRMTVLAPLWRGVLERIGIGARCVIPVRHPLAVAKSLARRDGFPVEKSVLLWTIHMLAAEAYTRDLPRAFVAYDALLTDWRAEVARIEAAHGAPLPRKNARREAQIDRFLTTDLRHNVEDGDLSRLPLAGPMAQDVYDWLAAVANDRPADPALLARAAEGVAALKAQIGMLISPLTRDLDVARSQLLAERQRRAWDAREAAKIAAELAALKTQTAKATAIVDSLLADR